jgi:hypothetical protein
VNFYGETSGSENKLFGRIGPICETLHLAVLRSTGRPPQPPTLSAAMPAWCHNIADKFVLTILKRVAALSPQGKFDARNYGRIIGVILRGITHFCREVPTQLKQEGLFDLAPEKEKKLVEMIDMGATIVNDPTAGAWNGKATPDLTQRFLRGSSDYFSGKTGGLDYAYIPFLKVKVETTGWDDQHGKLNTNPQVTVNQALSNVDGWPITSVGSTFNDPISAGNPTVDTTPPYFEVVFLIMVK